MVIDYLHCHDVAATDDIVVRWVWTAASAGRLPLITGGQGRDRTHPHRPKFGARISQDDRSRLSYASYETAADTDVTTEKRSGDAQ